MSPVHEPAVGATVEWYTPPDLFVRLGIRFDLDPASPESGPVPWVPARRFITPSEDGLETPWRGNVWLNPPYGPVGQRFIYDRLHFVRPDGTSGRSSFASALMAFGGRNARRLADGDFGWGL